MDFSGLLLIPLAAVVTAVWIVVAAISSKRAPGLRAPFLISYALGVLFMQPWLIASWQDAGMIVVMLLMMALSIAAGCLIGAIPGMIVVAIGASIRRRLKP